MAVTNGASLDFIQLLSFQDPETLMKKDKYGNTPLSIAIEYEVEYSICYQTNCQITEWILHFILVFSSDDFSRVYLFDVLSNSNI